MSKKKPSYGDILAEEIEYLTQIINKIANLSENYVMENSNNSGCGICMAIEPNPCEDWCPVGSMAEIRAICQETTDEKR